MIPPGPRIRTPEDKARGNIDEILERCGWAVQEKSSANLAASSGVALCNLSMITGEPDYTLFVDGKAIGTVEAKKEGHTLSGVEEQSGKYIRGVPSGMQAWRDPLPFAYESTGMETFFTNGLDPEPRSRLVFAFHRPETLLDWVKAEKQLHQRLREMPPLVEKALWPAQITAIENLERSFAANRPRALIQMATGAGKTFTAVNFVYRLVKYAGARRILFLVDRGNLGDQTLKEFQQFESPVNNLKFPNEHIIQHLTSNTLDTSARVVIGTIQRVYSMLKGETQPPPDLDDLGIEAAESGFKEPVPVEYNPKFPIETFDFIVTDECHRSIYHLWRQVLEYFDATLVGLTATPSKQTFGFFKQNLVMEYGHEQAVTDGVNVPYDVYKIRTQITESGSKVDAGFYVDKRDRLTRKKRWEQLDEDLTYEANQLDREVVAEDQIRTVIETFRDKLFTEIFPGRENVPKTLIYAKDDSHAEDIVRICREVFDKGNDFCQKITYLTTGVDPKTLIKTFRNSYDPRIAVTVDMIATGTDIKPLEIVFFMRSVKSRSFFEQMKGRGVRVISETEMEQVNPGIKRKSRFVIVDAVGVCERDKTDSRPLEKKPNVPFEKLLDAVALGARDADSLESLANRLIRLEKRLDDHLVSEVQATAKGRTLSEIAGSLLDAANPDKILAAAGGGPPGYKEPTATSLKAAADGLAQAAAAPLAGNPDLRQFLIKVHRTADQVIDVISRDRVLFAGGTTQSDLNARKTTVSFRDYIEKHKSEIEALQILYSRPYRHRLTEAMLKDLERKLRENHAAWTEDRLWDAFAAVEPTKVRGRSQAGRFADLVSLVHFSLAHQPVLEPFAESVHARFKTWVLAKISNGTSFSDEQLAWLELIRDHIATSLSIEPQDFDYSPFSQRGGLGKAHRLFGESFPKLLDELNEALAA
ncbi:MAG: DEAD/DEAH box helicase family protein [Nitrospirae bacterium]|nr:DEAD/DEAH box helicase family protein [Nitrospirota bacterium]